MKTSVTWCPTSTHLTKKITEACIPCLCFNQCDQKLIEELSRELGRILDCSNFKAHSEKKIVNGYVALWNLKPW